VTLIEPGPAAHGLLDYIEEKSRMGQVTARMERCDDIFGPSMAN
jgi:hypothetical protein